MEQLLEDISNRVSELVEFSLRSKRDSVRVEGLTADRISRIAAASQTFCDIAAKKLQTRDLTDPVNERFLLCVTQLRRSINWLKIAAAQIQTNPTGKEGKLTLQRASQLLLQSNIKSFALDDVPLVKAIVDQANEVNRLIQQARIASNVEDLKNMMTSYGPAVLKLTRHLSDRSGSIVDTSVKSKLDEAQNALKTEIEQLLRGVIGVIKTPHDTELENVRNEIARKLSSKAQEIILTTRLSHKNMFLGIQLDLETDSEVENADFISDLRTLHSGLRAHTESLQQAMTEHNFIAAIACGQAIHDQLENQIEISTKLSATYNDTLQGKMLLTASEGARQKEHALNEEIQQVVDCLIAYNADNFSKLIATLDESVGELVDVSGTREQQTSGTLLNCDQELHTVLQSIEAGNNQQAILSVRLGMKNLNKLLALAKSLLTDGSSECAQELKFYTDSLTQATSSVVLALKECLQSQSDLSLQNLTNLIEDTVMQAKLLKRIITTNSDQQTLELAAQLLYELQHYPTGALTAIDLSKHNRKCGVAISAFKSHLGYVINQIKDEECKAKVMQLLETISLPALEAESKELFTTGNTMQFENFVTQLVMNLTEIVAWSSSPELLASDYTKKFTFVIDEIAMAARTKKSPRIEKAKVNISARANHILLIGKAAHKRFSRVKDIKGVKSAVAKLERLIVELSGVTDEAVRDSSKFENLLSHMDSLRENANAICASCSSLPAWRRFVWSEEQVLADTIKLNSTLKNMLQAYSTADETLVDLMMELEDMIPNQAENAKLLAAVCPTEYRALTLLDTATNLETVSLYLQQLIPTPSSIAYNVEIENILKAMDLLIKTHSVKLPDITTRTFGIANKLQALKQMRGKPKEEMDSLVSSLWETFPKHGELAEIMAMTHEDPNIQNQITIAAKKIEHAPILIASSLQAVTDYPDDTSAQTEFLQLLHDLNAANSTIVNCGVAAIFNMAQIDIFSQKLLASVSSQNDQEASSFLELFTTFVKHQMIIAGWACDSTEDLEYILMLEETSQDLSAFLRIVANSTKSALSSATYVQSLRDLLGTVREKCASVVNTTDQAIFSGVSLFHQLHRLETSIGSCEFFPPAKYQAGAALACTRDLIDLETMVAITISNAQFTPPERKVLLNKISLRLPQLLSVLSQATNALLSSPSDDNVHRTLEASMTEIKLLVSQIVPLEEEFMNNLVLMDQLSAELQDALKRGDLERAKQLLLQMKKIAERQMALSELLGIVNPSKQQWLSDATAHIQELMRMNTSSFDEINPLLAKMQSGNQQMIMASLGNPMQFIENSCKDILGHLSVLQDECCAGQARSDKAGYAASQLAIQLPKHMLVSRHIVESCVNPREKRFRNKLLAALEAANRNLTSSFSTLRASPSDSELQRRMNTAIEELRPLLNAATTPMPAHMNPRERVLVCAKLLEDALKSIVSAVSRLDSSANDSASATVAQTLEEQRECVKQLQKEAAELGCTFPEVESILAELTELESELYSSSVEALETGDIDKVETVSSKLIAVSNKLASLVASPSDSDLLAAATLARSQIEKFEAVLDTYNQPKIDDASDVVDGDIKAFSSIVRIGTTLSPSEGHRATLAGTSEVIALCAEKIDENYGRAATQKEAETAVREATKTLKMAVAQSIASDATAKLLDTFEQSSAILEATKVAVTGTNHSDACSSLKQASAVTEMLSMLSMVVSSQNRPPENKKLFASTAEEMHSSAKIFNTSASSTSSFSPQKKQSLEKELNDTHKKLNKLIVTAFPVTTELENLMEEIDLVIHNFAELPSPEKTAKLTEQFSGLVGKYTKYAKALAEVSDDEQTKATITTLTKRLNDWPSSISKAIAKYQSHPSSKSSKRELAKALNSARSDAISILACVMPEAANKLLLKLNSLQKALEALKDQVSSDTDKANEAINNIDSMVKSLALTVQIAEECSVDPSYKKHILGSLECVTGDVSKVSSTFLVACGDPSDSAKIKDLVHEISAAQKSLGKLACVAQGKAGTLESEDPKENLLLIATAMEHSLEDLEALSVIRHADALGVAGQLPALVVRESSAAKALSQKPDVTTNLTTLTHLTKPICSATQSSLQGDTAALKDLHTNLHKASIVNAEIVSAILPISEMIPSTQDAINDTVSRATESLKNGDLNALNSRIATLVEEQIPRIVLLCHGQESSLRPHEAKYVSEIQMQLLASAKEAKEASARLLVNPDDSAAQELCAVALKNIKTHSSDFVSAYRSPLEAQLADLDKHIQVSCQKLTQMIETIDKATPHHLVSQLAEELHHDIKKHYLLASSLAETLSEPVILENPTKVSATLIPQIASVCNTPTSATKATATATLATLGTMCNNITNICLPPPKDSDVIKVVTSFKDSLANLKTNPSAENFRQTSRQARELLGLAQTLCTSDLDPAHKDLLASAITDLGYVAQKLTTFSRSGASTSELEDVISRGNNALHSMMLCTSSSAQVLMAVPTIVNLLENYERARMANQATDAANTWNELNTQVTDFVALVKRNAKTPLVAALATEMSVTPKTLQATPINLLSGEISKAKRLVDDILSVTESFEDNARQINKELDMEIAELINAARSNDDATVSSSQKKASNLLKQQAALVASMAVSCVDPLKSVELFTLAESLNKSSKAIPVAAKDFLTCHSSEALNMLIATAEEALTISSHVVPVDNRSNSCLTNITDLLTAALSRNNADFLHAATQLHSNFAAQKALAYSLAKQSKNSEEKSKLKVAADQLSHLAAELVSIAEGVMAHPEDTNQQAEYRALSLVAARCLNCISDPYTALMGFNSSLITQLTELGASLKARDAKIANKLLPEIRETLSKKLVLTRMEADLAVVTPVGKVHLLHECKLVEEGHKALPSQVQAALSGNSLPEALATISSLTDCCSSKPSLTSFMDSLTTLSTALSSPPTAGVYQQEQLEMLQSAVTTIEHSLVESPATPVLKTLALKKTTKDLQKISGEFKKMVDSAKITPVSTVQVQAIIREMKPMLTDTIKLSDTPLVIVGQIKSQMDKLVSALQHKQVMQARNHAEALKIAFAHAEDLGARAVTFASPVQAEEMKSLTAKLAGHVQEFSGMMSAPSVDDSKVPAVKKLNSAIMDDLNKMCAKLQHPSNATGTQVLQCACVVQQAVADLSHPSLTTKRDATQTLLALGPQYIDCVNQMAKTDALTFAPISAQIALDVSQMVEPLQTCLVSGTTLPPAMAKALETSNEQLLECFAPQDSLKKLLPMMIDASSKLKEANTTGTPKDLALNHKKLQAIVAVVEQQTAKMPAPPQPVVDLLPALSKLKKQTQEPSEHNPSEVAGAAADIASKLMAGMSGTTEDIIRTTGEQLGTAVSKLSSALAEVATTTNHPIDHQAAETCLNSLEETISQALLHSAVVKNASLPDTTAQTNVTMHAATLERGIPQLTQAIVEYMHTPSSADRTQCDTCINKIKSAANSIVSELDSMAQRAEEERRRLEEEEERKKKSLMTPAMAQDEIMQAANSIELQVSQSSANTPKTAVMGTASTLAEFIALLALSAKSKDRQGILDASKKIGELVKTFIEQAKQRAASCQDPRTQEQILSWCSAAQNFSVQLKILCAVKAASVNDDPTAKSNLIKCAKGIAKSVCEVVKLEEVALLIKKPSKH
ncbi:hypothetical protein Pelo_1318 [Pelomyxa schiedti]|nr:hypothetical protein Pelo_1318 [Pelomyxa schiedti]